MITLITGIPGMGKTSLLVSMLLEYEKAAVRPLFVWGIPDLKIDHNVAPPIAEWTHIILTPEDPTVSGAYFCFPPNAILVIDECQKVYRPRSSASKVPDHVSALETHRHTGLDIILLTQKPRLVDMNVRELVGRHIHIRSGLLGRFLYEWPHIADGESRTDRSDAVKRKFSPPKKSFESYKSAEVHTKQKFRFHQGFIFLALALGFLGYQGLKASEIFNKNVGTHLSASQAAPRSGAEGSATQLPLIVAVDSRLPIIEAMQPVDVHDPLSAPIYAEVRPAVVAPEIKGCIASKKSCSCYTQQNTPIWLPQEQCRSRAAGHYYDPYLNPQAASRTEVMSRPTSEQQTRPAPEGEPEQI